MENKLQQGDYVRNLTKEQFEELIEIEDFPIELSYEKSNKTLGYDGSCLYTENFIPKTELTFSEFKQRAINTFNHAN